MRDLRASMRAMGQVSECAEGGKVEWRGAVGNVRALGQGRRPGASPLVLLPVFVCHVTPPPLAASANPTAFQAAKVPLEPPEQARLLDATAQLPAVVGGGSPGCRRFRRRVCGRGRREWG